MEEAATVMMIDLSRLVVTSQPMEEASEIFKRSLRNSIEDPDIGLIYPLVVRSISNGMYDILDGRTRYQVLKTIGWTTVKCIVRNQDEGREAVPYDCELYRRHLKDEQINKYTSIRNKKKEEAGSRYIEDMLNRIPKSMREGVHQYISGLQDIGAKKKQIKLLVDLSPADLQQFLINFDAKNRCEDLELSILKTEESSDRLKAQLLKLEEEKEKEIQRRLDKFTADTRKKVEEIQAQVFIIPEDEEEKTQIMKGIEEAVKRQFKKEIEESSQSIIIMHKDQKTLRQELDKKQDNIETQKREIKDLQLELAKADDMVKDYADIIEQRTDVERVLQRFDLLGRDMKNLNKLLIERQFIAEEIGEDNRTKLDWSLSDLYKVLDETKSAISEI